MKWAVVSAFLAFALSLILGISSGVAVVHIILRTLIFTIIFFGIGFGVRYIINGYFPELLYTNSEDSTKDSGKKGSILDITLDSISEYALPEYYKVKDGNEMGNIEELVSGAFKPAARPENSMYESQMFESRMSERNRASSSKIQKNPVDEDIDRNGEEVYNDMSGFQPMNEDLPVIKTKVERPVFTPGPINDNADMGDLPDLDMMSKAFSSASGGSQYNDGFGSVDGFEEKMQPVKEAEPSKYNKGGKPSEMKGDFKPKELAEGLRTLLNNDKG